MDPLSISAGIVGLVQAAGLIAKSIRALRSISKGPDGFFSLCNEVAMLQITINQLQSDLDSVASKSSPPSKLLLHSVSKSVESVQSVATKLESLSVRLCKPLKSCEVEPPEKAGLNTNPTIPPNQLSKIAFLREKGAIDRLRQELRQVREGLALCVSSVISSETYAIYKKLFYPETETLTVASPRHRQTVTIFDAYQIQQQLDARLSVAQSYHEEYSRNLQQQLERIVSELSALQVQNDQSQNGPTALSRQSTSWNRIVRLQASVRTTCEPTCRCRCHIRTRIQTPLWLRSVIGTSFVDYGASPTSRKATCDSARCTNKSHHSVNIGILFPAWLLRKGIYISTSMSWLTGAGASLHIRFPRVIDDTDVQWLIYLEDMKRVQGLISQGRLLPWDITEHGVPFLMVRNETFQIPVAKTRLTRNA